MVMLVQIVLRLIEDALKWLVLLARSDESVRAENLVLRRQLAMFVERGIQPRRVDAATRVSLAVLTRLFESVRFGGVKPPMTALSHSKEILDTSGQSHRVVGRR